MTSSSMGQRVSAPGRCAVLWAAARLTGAADRLRRRVVRGPSDRGDVPGWVLVTIMTAGLVVALWAIAGPKLGQLFTDAVDKVQSP